MTPLAATRAPAAGPFLPGLALRHDGCVVHAGPPSKRLVVGSIPAGDAKPNCKRGTTRNQVWLSSWTTSVAGSSAGSTDEPLATVLCHWATPGVPAGSLPSLDPTLLPHSPMGECGIDHDGAPPGHRFKYDNHGVAPSSPSLVTGQ